MMTAVNGYYNGKNIVLDENVKLAAGQRVIVTIIGEAQDSAQPEKPEDIDFSRFVGRGKKMFDTDAQGFIREMRDNDRI